jgi:hypothetical protein
MGIKEKLFQRLDCIRDEKGTYPDTLVVTEEEAHELIVEVGARATPDQWSPLVSSDKGLKLMGIILVDADGKPYEWL